MLVASRVRRDELRSRVGDLFRNSQPTGPPDATGDTPGRIGIEVELIGVRRTSATPAPVSLDDIQAALAVDPSLPEEGHITFEPGAQVEISPPPAASVSELLPRVEALVARLRRCGAPAGIEFVTPGANPWHRAEVIGLQTPKPRYQTMQARYDQVGRDGRRMMRLTAALQVGIDMGPPAVAAERWLLLNRAGPALTAAFANSPVLEGRVTGMASSRTAVWQGTDPSRTGFGGEQVGADESGPDAAAYLDFVAGAAAIPLPRAGAGALDGETFGAWLRRSEREGIDRPDEDDLDHHLTTLFPPVRPRHHFEVRYLDALPERWRAVPVAVLAALAYDPLARRQALERLGEGKRGEAAWALAADKGVRDPETRRLAVDLFEVALGGMGQLPEGYIDADVEGLALEYLERYPRVGRSPADDQREKYQIRPEDISTWM